MTFLSWQAGVGIALLGVVLWIVGEKIGRSGRISIGKILILLGAALAIWRAVNGDGNLGFLLMAGLSAALVTWFVGLVMRLPAVRAGARNWIIPLLIVFAVRNFGWESYRIPSESMLPVLQPGHFVLINRHAYSLNVQPAGMELTRFEEPKRGDILVFRHPKSDEILIKRLIGLPGETVEVGRWKISINGTGIRSYGMQMFDHGDYREFREELEGGRNWVVRRRRGKYAQIKEGKWQIPEDAYFVLGDNRENSSDSRFWGMVKRNAIMGRADYIWLFWPPGRDPERMWEPLTD